MTVLELQVALSKFPGDTQIYVATECHGCFEPALTLWLDTRETPEEKPLLVIDSGLKD